jgi:hypothetical protein
MAMSGLRAEKHTRATSRVVTKRVDERACETVEEDVSVHKLVRKLVKFNIINKYRIIIL